MGATFHAHIDKATKWRQVKDKVAVVAISTMGIGVIFAIVLIMVFLLSVVWPMLKPVSVESTGQYHLQLDSTNQGLPLQIVMDEYQYTATAWYEDAHVGVFDVATGEWKGALHLPFTGQHIAASSTVDFQHNVWAFALKNGDVHVVQLKNAVSYPDGIKTITPELLYPYGESPLALPAFDGIITKLAVKQTEDGVSVLALTNAGDLHYWLFDKQLNLFTDEIQLSLSEQKMFGQQKAVAGVHMDVQMRRGYVVNVEGSIDFYQLGNDAHKVSTIRSQTFVDQPVTHTVMLLGDVSLMVGYANGGIGQFFTVRDENYNESLKEIRTWHEQTAAIETMAIDWQRKGFYALDDQGNLGIYHATAHQNVWLDSVMKSDDSQGLVVSSFHGDKLFVLDGQQRFSAYHVDNEYPEVSFHALWEKVWYEGYDEPTYSWQSSSSSNDFEPKVSLAPLTFGTMKAAFYALLVAIPIALLGAIYAACFMSPSLRQVVKPVIEIMEAMPTVIIGFLAGLWLAPVLEAHLPGVFAMAIFLPLTIVLFGLFWATLPKKIRLLVPDGWRAVLLIPVVILSGWFALSVSGGLEHAFFAGDMRVWLTDEMGIGYDQRNALVIGIAMGFAVIPTIFSIAEDAVYSVPRHLVNGSLALGATPWQTLVGVVLPTASPGMFSAVMMGMGRAVGETMIVLMATGNTPIMDFNIFEGLRTLSANIAVEMPEAEVGSSHYRILFLSGLVLFVFTFFFNAMAESVRQRMLKRYGGL